MQKFIGNDYLTPEEFRETISRDRMPLPFCLEDIIHQIKGAINTDANPAEIFELYCTMYSLDPVRNFNLRVIINRTINIAVKKRDEALVPKV
jgi:hypothetical protein